MCAIWLLVIINKREIQVLAVLHAVKQQFAKGQMTIKLNGLFNY